MNNWLKHNSPAQANPFGPTDENLVAGMKLYKGSCAECHGDAKGASAFGRSFYPAAPQFTTGHVPHDDDAVLFTMVSRGIRLTGMPSFTKMGTKDEEIWKMVTFVKKLNDLPAPIAAQWKAL